MNALPASARARFTSLKRAVSRTGRDLDFFALSDAADLALELEADEPDEERVRSLVRRLGLDVEAL